MPDLMDMHRSMGLLDYIEDQSRAEQEIASKGNNGHSNRRAGNNTWL